MKAAAAHRNVEKHSFTRDILAAEGHRESHFHTIVFASVLVYPDIPNSPSQGAETLATELALIRINIKDARDNLPQAGSGNSSNKFASTAGAS
jgi:hypothetical protein